MARLRQLMARRAQDRQASLRISSAWNDARRMERSSHQAEFWTKVVREFITFSADVKPRTA